MTFEYEFEYEFEYKVVYVMFGTEQKKLMTQCLSPLMWTPFSVNMTDTTLYTYLVTNSS